MPGARLEITDTTGLTDADWREINKVRQAYAKRGVWKKL